MKNPINLKISVSVMLLVLLTFCADDDPIQYQLETLCIPEETGTVTPLPGMYNEGTEIELKATPIAEYIFKNWTGDVSGNVNPLKIIMLEDKNITAVFEKVNYSLTIDIIGEGTVNQEIIQAKSSTDYESGTTVQLNAVPDDDWKFVKWSGDHTGAENPIQITIDKAMNIVATFELENLEKTYVPDDNFEQALIDLGYDDQIDDYVYTQRIRNIEDLRIENKEIEDLTGIEDFENLTTLILTNNNLQSLNISENTKLQFLNCSQNQLTSLDISQNISLYNMVVIDNLLTCIQATESQITSRLAPHAFAPGYLTDEDVIFSLDCDALNDAITFVPNDNFEKALIELGYDDILDDYVKTIIIAGILELDLSNRNITDLTGIEDFTMLENLNCRNNELTQLDISKNYSLTFGTLDISNNNITCVQISLGQSQVSGMGIILDWTNDDGTDYSLDCGY